MEEGNSWEALLLAFAMVLTVLLGVSYGMSVMFRTPIPWFVVLLVSVAVTLGLRYLRYRRDTRQPPRDR